MFKSIIFVFVFLQSFSAGASSFPTNAYSPLSDKYNNGYPKIRYQSVLDKLIEVYSPIVEARGGTFHILRDWSDGAVNMWAFKLGQEYWLEMPGGMSRYHLINEEGFLLSACHELGHLLGGAPFKGSGSSISLEGQSDYYATKDCIDLVLTSVEPYKKIDVRLEVKEACALISESSLCERALEGALSLTSYYAELEKVPAPRLSTPSKVIVSETLKVHPPAQCRLDTFLAGYEKKERPKCWYKN